MIGVKPAGLAGLVEHVVGQFGLTHDDRLDLHIERLGRTIVLGLEGIDDKLHVGGAVLVGPRHMALKTDDFGIGDHHAAVGKQFFQADAGTQFPDLEQRVALLVMNEDVVEFHLIEGRERDRPDIDLGVQILA